MTPTQVATFAIAALLLVAVPGPSVIFIIGRTLVLGRAGAVVSDLGIALGSLVQVALIALGLGLGTCHGLTCRGLPRGRLVAGSW